MQLSFLLRTRRSSYVAPWAINNNRVAMLRPCFGARSRHYPIVPRRPYVSPASVLVLLHAAAVFYTVETQTVILRIDIYRRGR